jgi:hypothetical protein
MLSQSRRLCKPPPTRLFTASWLGEHIFPRLPNQSGTQDLVLCLLPLRLYEYYAIYRQSSARLTRGDAVNQGVQVLSLKDEPRLPY